MLFLGITCVTVSNLTGFPVSEPVGAEVKDKVAVVWECPESQIDQITEFVHCFNVGVFSTEKKEPTLKYLMFFYFWIEEKKYIAENHN